MTLRRTDSFEVASQNEVEERRGGFKEGGRNQRGKSDKTVPDCLHVCRVFGATPPFLQYNWTKT